MTVQVRTRTRRRPDPMAEHYKEFASRVRGDRNYRQKIRDRAAYVFVTGQFPSHLRRTSVEALRHMTSYSRRPVALDRRSGNMQVNAAVVADLELNSHPMVQKTREKIAEGYFIQPSLGINTRRNYWKIYMYKLNPDGLPFGKMIVQADSSIKAGW